jgi:hypothetical protein
MLEENIGPSSFPNIFYDLIVFVSPTVVLAAGLISGAGGWHLLVQAFSGLAATALVVVLLGLVLLGYEYGRLAEALSSSLVAAPLRFLAKRHIFLHNSNFNMSLERECDLLPIWKELPQMRRDKWSLYFYASIVAPHLGRDLLKRYAWEKLSRSSAMTFLILASLSWIRIFGSTMCLLNRQTQAWGFGSVLYTTVATLFTIAVYYEYYQRNAWNNDLLCKTLPVLLYAAKFGPHMSYNIGFPDTKDTPRIQVP